MSELLRLIIEFIGIGSFAVGGGLATIPFLEEMVSHYDWLSNLDLSIIIAMASSLPGPIGVSMASFVGFLGFGIVGSVLAPLALITPCFLLIVIIYNVLDKFQNSMIVQEFFKLIRPIVIALLAVVTINMVAINLFDFSLFNSLNDFALIFNWLKIFMFVIGWLIYKKFKIHPALLIIAFGFLGVAFQL
ncbi:MAG: chromate transporter [Erysipelotrichaceae bacterium]